MPQLASPVSEPRNLNSLLREDRCVHDWYRFVLSYPPHLVRQYCEVFGISHKSLLLDPFCGTGTTLVEAKFQRIASVGCDAHPFAALVSRVKTNWNLDVNGLRKCRKMILRAAEAAAVDYLEGLRVKELPNLLDSLSDEEKKILPEGFLSERPLRRLLIVKRAILDSTRDSSREEREFFLVALAHVIANGAGNFAFGPEIYRTKPKDDYDVLGHYARQLSLMEDDLLQVQERGLSEIKSAALELDARTLTGLPDCIDAVITSPPYPNEKDYTRTTRVESLILGQVGDKKSLRRIKESLLRSNTRNIFVDDHDSDEVREFDSIQRISDRLKPEESSWKRRVDLSGFTTKWYRIISAACAGTSELCGRS